jgi:tRNA nucleotidyltransferase (CCA-adding enzyme)
MNITKKLNHLDLKLIAIIKRIGRFADKHNIRAFLVGGFVRDIFLKIKNFDIDIAVDKQGINFAQFLSKKLNLKIISHQRFGTAILSLGNLKVDIATLRKEAYPYPGSLPVVREGSLADDLARRDFSVNALAVGINKDDFGMVFDHFNGLADIEHKDLRVLHDKSFLDDPTRILRLVRFAARFNFSIETKTLNLLKQARLAGALENMQKQRVREELFLIFEELEPEKAIKLLDKLYGLKFIHKNLRLAAADYQRSVKVREVCDWFEREFYSRRKIDIWLMYFIVFLSGLEVDELEAICKDFVLKRGESIRLLSFKRSQDIFKKLNKASLKPSEVYNILNPLSYEVILLFFAEIKNKQARRHIINFFKRYNLTRIKLTGNDLKKLGVRPGPRFKELLGLMFKQKLNSRLLTKYQELSALKRLIR